MFYAYRMSFEFNFFFFKLHNLIKMIHKLYILLDNSLNYMIIALLLIYLLDSYIQFSRQFPVTLGFGAFCLDKPWYITYQILLHPEELLLHKLICTYKCSHLVLGELRQCGILARRVCYKYCFMTKMRPKSLNKINWFNGVTKTLNFQVYGI